MSHNHKPIHHRIPTLPIPYIRQMQILKIPVVEKKSLVVIERDRAPALIIENMYAVSLHTVHLCTI